MNLILSLPLKFKLVLVPLFHMTVGLYGVSGVVHSTLTPFQQTRFHLSETDGLELSLERSFRCPR